MLLVQGIKEEAGGNLRGQEEVAPGSQVVADLDLFAGGVIIQEDVGGGLGDDGLSRRRPSGRAALPGGWRRPRRPGRLAGPGPRLRPEVPDQPQDLEPPETEDQPHQPESPRFSRGHIPE